MSRPVAAELRSVTHWYGRSRALARVTLTLGPGTLVALLGPNGAGKTTLVRMLLGLTTPTEGSVRVWGHVPTSAGARRRLGAMLQVGRVPETLTVAEHVQLFSSYYGTPVPVQETLRLAGVEDVEDRWFGELSAGQRQRALFALAICGRPELLVLDEPTVGLDVDARRRFWTTVRSLKDRGCAVLLTTHDIEEADAVADRVVILQRGEALRDGPPEAIARELGGRRIRCRTTLPIAAISALDGVRSCGREHDVTVVLADAAEPVVRDLLLRDPALSELDVTRVGLEDAFVALTGRGGAHVDVADARDGL